MTDGTTALCGAGAQSGSAAITRVPAVADVSAGPGSDSLFRNIRRRMATPERSVCCLAIDAEEDFDWTRPVHATGYSTQCMQRITDLHEIVSAYGLKPTYLLTYPVLEDSNAVSMIRRQYARGECDMGIQLHPWVTPPFDEPADQASYLGSLQPAVEERKLRALTIRFRTAFGFDPKMFRAGRYGLSAATTSLLEKYGFTIDTSLAPRTDFRQEGGPDFSDYDCEPFWFGEERRLLELPLCRALVGWSGRRAPCLYKVASATAMAHWHVPAMLSRLRCAERVTLSPEGNDTAAMLRLLRGRQRRGQRIFSLSFHSSSLAPGRNPYVRGKPDLHIFYDRLSAILDTMASHGFAFASLADIPAILENGP
jgi:predicted deacetylase